MDWASTRDRYRSLPLFCWFVSTMIRYQITIRKKDKSMNNSLHFFRENLPGFVEICLISEPSNVIIKLIFSQKNFRFYWCARASVDMEMCSCLCLIESRENRRQTSERLRRNDKMHWRQSLLFSKCLKFSTETFFIVVMFFVFVIKLVRLIVVLVSYPKIRSSINLSVNKKQINRSRVKSIESPPRFDITH